MYTLHLYLHTQYYTVNSVDIKPLSAGEVQAARQQKLKRSPKCSELGMFFWDVGDVDAVFMILLDQFLDPFWLDVDDNWSWS